MIRTNRHAGCGRALWCLAVFLAVWLSAVPSRSEPRTRSVLVLEESDAIRGPFYAAMFAAMRSRMYAAGLPLSIYIENLDLAFFSGRDYEDYLRRMLRYKYREHPIGVVVTIGAGALDRALKWRSELWPGVPIVFSVVEHDRLKTLQLPADVTGRTIRLRLSDMVAAARAVVPDLKHVAVLGEDFDTQAATAFRGFPAELAAVAAELDVLDLTGQPLAEVLRRVADLPPDSAVLYTPIYTDGTGAFFPAVEAVPRIAAAARRPIISPIETYVGRGSIGGFVLVPSVIGEEAADQVLAILGGEDPAVIPVEAGTSLRPVFDWNEMQRWRVDQNRLPPGSEIRNRPLPVWRQYPAQSALIALVVLLQSGFIAAILYEARRRRRAEQEARVRMNELAHVNRQATAGELSASIAHELAQPLGATLAHTEAAQFIAQSQASNVALIEDILLDIKRETMRASEIIQRLRRLLKKAPLDMAPVDLNRIVDEVFKLVAAQAEESGVELVKVEAPEPVIVRGDAIQLQQVILNLVVNGIDSIRAAGRQKGRVIGRVVRLRNNLAEISVVDTGQGIPADQLKSVFEPFYTTKEHGMGMGLSIARTIVESHGGSLVAEKRAGGGAVFRIHLPLLP